MTAMRNSVYAILAVVVGVMLVGLLPGQLSNLAAPAPASLQVGGKESAPTFTTPRGQYNTTLNDTIVTSLPSHAGNITLGATGASTAAQEAQASADAAETAANAAKKSDAAGYAFTVTTVELDPYADLKYYGMWGVGLLAALAVYLASKRMLG